MRVSPSRTCCTGVLAALAACQPGQVGGSDHTPLEVEVEVVSNPFNGTVITLAWDEAICPGATPLVSLEPDDGEAVPSTESSSQVVLLGLPPDTDHEFILDLELGGEVCGTGAGAFSTRTPAGEAPDIQLMADDGTTRGWLMTSFAMMPAAAAMLDTSGNVVWYWPERSAETVSRAILSHDRSTVIYGAYVLYPRTPQEAINEIVRVSIDGQSIERIPTRLMHHDLLERPDGVIAYIGSREIDTQGDGQPWSADLIVELNPDGTDRVVWDAWDVFPWDEAKIPDSPDLARLREWTHGNALQYSEADDAYYLSMRGRSSIVKIDAETGETLAVFGGEHSTFDLVGGTWPVEQHQFRVMGDRLLIFDNGSPEFLDSRVVEFEVDEIAGTAQQMWQYHDDPPIYEVVLGDVEQLDTGNRMVVWSTAGQIDVITPTGDLVWRTNTPVGGALGYVQWLEELAPSGL